MTKYKGNRGTLNILIALHDEPQGLTAHGVFRKLISEDFFMGINSISPTLCVLAKERLVKKIYAPCSCCGTTKARYILTAFGLERMNDRLSSKPQMTQPA